MFDVNLIGARIKERRTELDLSLDDIANKVKTARSTIQRYEAGKIARPKIPVLHSIAHALQVDPDWLLGISDKKELNTWINATVNNDPELNAYLEDLRTRPEMRMLFSVAKGATKEDVEKAVAIIEALRKTEGK
jgi:transcriptional regulator with XRE-family HTH domain